MLNTEHHPTRHSGGHLDVHAVVPARLVLAEEERPADLVAEVQRNPEAALQTVSEQGAIAGQSEIELLRSLLEEHDSTGRQRCGGGELGEGDFIQTRRRRFTDRSEELVLPATGLEENDAHRVEFHDNPDRIAHGLQDLTEVERCPKHLRDALQQSGAVLSAPLPIDLDDRLD